MILISSEVNDFDTNYVIDWMLYYNMPFKRINKEDNVEHRFINKTFFLKSNHLPFFDIEEISNFWYRRGNLNLKHRSIEDKVLHFFCVEETNTLNEYINFKISNRKKINGYYDTKLNKLIVLEVARNIGIDIPKTLIVSKREELDNILSSTSIVITKGITQSNTFQFNSNGAMYMSYTNRITKDTLHEIPKNFYPSLIQEEINKKYELRIFFLNNEFWSMAIFTQKNKDTQTDSRRYGNVKSRCVPFKLPEFIELKLMNLMNAFSLNSGSIDMIVEEDTDKFYFLEINPVGQFGMTSYPCNYNIEKIMAKFLGNE